MLSIISTMSAPASGAIEVAPAVIWAMLACLVVASLGVLHAAWVARRRARMEAVELEKLGQLAGRLSESRGATHRPLAA